MVKMAKIVLENDKNYPIRLRDCAIGDIVLINEEIYIITDGSAYSGTFVLLNLKTTEQEEFKFETVCSLYQKTLHFKRSDFQDYLN